MEGAARLATKYGKYCYLMAIDTEEFVYSFTEATPAPTDAVYFAKVRELHDASVAIGECSLKCELFKLVRVDTSEATKVGASWFAAASGVVVFHKALAIKYSRHKILRCLRGCSVVARVTGAQGKSAGGEGCVA